MDRTLWPQPGKLSRAAPYAYRAALILGLWPAHVRADLRRFYSRDILACTAPELVALVNNLLTFDSTTARAANKHEPMWGVTDVLLSDIWATLTGKPHPGRPKPSRARRRTPESERHRAEALSRARARQAAIRDGLIT